MRKLIFLTGIALMVLSQSGISQIVNVDYSRLPVRQSLTDTTETEPPRQVQVMSQGFVDFFSNGKMQGTAQILRINIGEPGVFYIPLFLMVGASGDGLGQQELNENTVANLLNPIGGIFNGTINGQNNLFAVPQGVTSLKLAYQASGKLVNAQDSLTGEAKFLGAGYGNVGLFFQTGAWEPDAMGNMGVFWLQAKATGSFAFDNAVLSDVFGSALEENYFLGYSIDLGIEINNRVNLKAGVYQFLNNQTIDLMDKPMFKFSFDYNLN